MKLITNFLLINLIHFPIINLTLTFNQNLKIKKIQDKLNGMYLMLFNNDFIDSDNWNEIRDNMWNDLVEVIRKNHKINPFDAIDYNASDFMFSGLETNYLNKNKEIFGFFDLVNIKQQIKLKYHKHLTSKQKVIEKMISIAEKYYIEEDEDFANWSISLHEKWKLTLYNWIGKEIILNEELIKVVLNRFEFDRLEKTGQNSYIAWFNYFDTYETIPVKIVVQKKDKEREKENDNSGRSFFNWVKNIFWWIAPAGVLGIIGYLFYMLNVKKIPKIKINNQYYYDNDDVAENYQIPLMSQGQNFIINNYGNNITTVTNTNTSFLHKILLRITQKFIRMTKSNFMSVSKNNKLKSDSDTLDLSVEVNNWDQKYNELFENLKLEDISHNLDFMKWGFFDKMRYGKIKIKNFPYEFVFKILPSNFPLADQILCEQFYQEISNILSKLYIFKSAIKQNQLFVNVSTIILDFLNNSKLIINGQNYFFATDSFWIEEVVESEEIIKVKLNHLLFSKPIFLEIPYIY